MLKFMIGLAVLAIIPAINGQCSRCSSGGSVRYTTSYQPQYETTVSRHESQPVYYYPSEQRYSHSSPSQVVYSQPSYQQTYYESQPPVTFHTRRTIISSEPYPVSYNQGTRYYSQSQPSVVYRDYNTQGYSPCSGGVRSCGSY